MYDLGPECKAKQLQIRNKSGIFLSGNHSLSETILTMTDVSNITLQGEQLVTMSLLFSAKMSQI